MTEELKAPNAPHGVTNTTKSYNDWPNDAGVRRIFAYPQNLLAELILFFQFEIFHEETDPVELKVSGRIPAYAA